MTLSVRNNYFRGGIILAVISLTIIIAGGSVAFQAFPEAAASAAYRSGGITRLIAANFSSPEDYVPFYTMLASAVYSLLSIILILFFFEKTQSPEILFVGFFVISLAFEFARIVIPLKEVYSFPLVYLVSVSKFLLFGRVFGLLSLFAASIYAAGLDFQRQQSILFMVILSALTISMNIPVDVLIWDTSLKIRNGYNQMYILVETGILAVTIITFFISAYTRGSRNYISIGIGAFMAYAGRNMLINSDTWISAVPGFLILASGTWFVCTRLHREYLWL